MLSNGSVDAPSLAKASELQCSSAEKIIAFLHSSHYKFLRAKTGVLLLKSSCTAYYLTKS